MLVFADYSEAAAPLIRVWVRSWTAQGWTPRLLFKSKPPVGAVKVTPWVVNFSHKSGPIRPKRYGAPGWQNSPLVRFPSTATEEDILNALPRVP